MATPNFTALTTEGAGKIADAMKSSATKTATLSGLNTGVNLALTVGQTWVGWNQARMQREQAASQLDFAKKQHQDNKDRYEKTLNNQQEAINTLANTAFAPQAYNAPEPTQTTTGYTSPTERD